MAEMVTRHRVDDLERRQGNEVAADEQMVFSIDSRSYVIDLSAVNAKLLREVLEPYVEAATPLLDAQGLTGRLSPHQAKRAELKAIRDWALAQGVSVSNRGRVPDSLIKAYERVNGPTLHQHH